NVTGMITGIGHVAFRVTDLERALDFYCGKLGFQEAFRLEREGEPSPWIVYLRLAQNQFIELFPQGTEGMVQARGMAAGYNHYCRGGAERRGRLAGLGEGGVGLGGEPIQGRDTNWQFWLTDPDGNAIELMQIAGGSPQAAADARLAAG